MKTKISFKINQKCLHQADENQNRIKQEQYESSSNKPADTRITFNTLSEQIELLSGQKGSPTGRNKQSSGQKEIYSSKTLAQPVKRKSIRAKPSPNRSKGNLFEQTPRPSGQKEIYSSKTLAQPVKRKSIRAKPSPIRSKGNLFEQNPRPTGQKEIHPCKSLNSTGQKHFSQARIPP
ncbi:hypothetical protein ACQKMN_04455 [Ureibacillus composti]